MKMMKKSVKSATNLMRKEKHKVFDQYKGLTREHGPYKGTGKFVGQIAFDMIPAILMTLQFVVLISMMANDWFNKDPAEMPYSVEAPGASLVVGCFSTLYNILKWKSGKIPVAVVIVSGLWQVVTVVLLILAWKFPARQCCCPGGVKAERVDMDSCANKQPGKDNKEEDP